MPFDPNKNKPLNELHLTQEPQQLLQNLQRTSREKYEALRKILKNFEMDFPEPKICNVLPEYHGRKLFLADKESRVKLRGFAELMGNGGWDITIEKIICRL